MFPFYRPRRAPARRASRDVSWAAIGLWYQCAGRALAAAAAALLIFAGTAAAQAGGTAADPVALYRALNDLRVDPSQVYAVHDLRLRRDVVSLFFSEGKLTFLSALNGRETGAIFTGKGRVLALPSNPAERRSLAKFTGMALLDQPFEQAYLRFTDAAGDELRRQLAATGAAKSEAPPGSLPDWNLKIGNLNPWHSLRILEDWLSTRPQPYFYARLGDTPLGTFDVLVDDRREEQVLIGQTQTVNAVQYFDVWASFARTDQPRADTRTFVPLGYSIDTTILPDASQQATAKLRLRARRGGERVIPLELSRFLGATSATGENGAPLPFFPNDDPINRREPAKRDNDLLLVVLPQAPPKDAEFTITVKYTGTVISDAGNAVFFVGERGGWYPHIEGLEFFAPFDLTFHWPKKLELVATGERIEERVDGDVRTGRWRSNGPIAVAGFNLGEYVSETTGGAKPKINVFANRQLELAISARVQAEPDSSINPPRWNPSTPAPNFEDFELPPIVRPAAVLDQLSARVADAIRFYERFAGPFPFPTLDISPIPGTVGQGWPGLLYLPTVAYLPSQTQRKVGIGEQEREAIEELLPFHEVAHQWWGNVVAPASYRDAWIEEAFANYLALLYAQSRKASSHPLQTWLDHYRKQLVTKIPGTDTTPDEAGPLVLGNRLTSSKTPGAYEPLAYGKGTWVVHMLRMMLRDPKAKDPDARFEALMLAILQDYRQQPFSTAEFQAEVEKAMTPEMDLEGNHRMNWFFDQWVRDSGIPQYSAGEFHVKRRGREYEISGKLAQTGVPDTFTEAVPVYAVGTNGKNLLLGSVVTEGPETPFHFTSPVRPARLQIDPEHTILCTRE